MAEVWHGPVTSTAQHLLLDGGGMGRGASARIYGPNVPHPDPPREGEGVDCDIKDANGQKART